MNNTQTLLAALRGEAVGRIPFAPRMDLWYIANRARGTLPGSLRRLDLPGLARVLGLDCHALKADLTHADGNNGPLLDLYPACGVDILESVCTEPMIPIRMDALRQSTAGRCDFCRARCTLAILCSCQTTFCDLSARLSVTGRTIMPAPTVKLLIRSTTTKAPVAGLFW